MIKSAQTESFPDLKEAALSNSNQAICYASPQSQRTIANLAQMMCSKTILTKILIQSNKKDKYLFQYLSVVPYCVV